MIHVVKGMGSDLTSLEVRMCGAFNQVSQELEEAAKVASDAERDIGASTPIKHMVTDAQLDARG